MNLRLRYPPTPEFAAQHADLVVGPALSVDKVRLDYSPDSLKNVDDIFESLRRDGVKEDQVAETIFAFGCYVGEVLVRNIGGSWRLPEQSGIPLDAQKHFPFMVVVTPASAVWSPITKTFKLFQQGRVESTYHLWSLASEKG